MKDGSTWLELSSETRLEGAVINDEVSHRVLSFVAPVLDGATRVQGRVSFELAEAAFPDRLGRREEQALAQGKLLFDDVRFMPGELADQLLGVFRLESKPLVELREPVSVRIPSGKIYQNGDWSSRWATWPRSHSTARSISRRTSTWWRGSPSIRPGRECRYFRHWSRLRGSSSLSGERSRNQRSTAKP